MYHKEDTNNVNNREGIAMFSIDLKDVNLATGNQEEFINGILYGSFKKKVKETPSGAYINKTLNLNSSVPVYFTDIIYETPEDYFKKAYQIQKINVSESLYTRLQGKRIEEHLGTYYQEDEDDGIDATAGGIPSTENAVPEANKNKKRIITYVVKN